MKSRGVEHSVLTDIANIQKVLKGYQKGFPIIKELVQNAEDAGATVINIGWHPGFPGEKGIHPLLIGPAICMVNNGPFSEDNRNAICQVGLGTKGADEQTIGRFGLGLKSVFHLCEAFFFMASSEANPGIPRFVDIFNPWYGKHHAEWDTGGKIDEELIINALKTFLPPHPWFSIWLPLRKKNHCDKGVYPIIHEWPGDHPSLSKNFEEIFQDELPDTLPMLSRLREIKYWVFNTYISDWDLLYLVTVKNDSIRSAFPQANPGCRIIKGQINSRSRDGAGIPSTSYGGVESWLQDPLFRLLREEEEWPNVIQKTHEGPGGQSSEEKEKGIPHCCAYFTERKVEGFGKLRIKWSVFLPLGNEPEEINLRDTSKDISLFLHGFFFLNSERTNIDGLEISFKKKETIYQRWNEALARSGTIAQLIPALANFVEFSRLKHKEIRDITEAIIKSRLHAEFKECICKNAQWVYILGDKFNSWKHLKAEDKILGMPLPSREINSLPFDVFPSLGLIVSDNYVTFGNPQSYSLPALSTKNCNYWSEEMLIALFDGITENNIRDDGTANYLSQFVLEEIPRDINSSVWSKIDNVPLKLTKLIHNGQISRRSIKEIIDFVERKCIFSIRDASDKNKLHLLQSICPDFKFESIESQDDEVYYIDRLVSDRVTIPPLTDLAMAQIVYIAERLGNLTSRAKLLDILTKSSYKESIVKTIRYLLHGTPIERDNDSVLYIPSKEYDESLWNRLIKRVLQHKGEDWRIIDTSFSGLIREADYKHFGLKKAGEEAARLLLQESILLLRTLDTSGFSEEERTRMLINFSDEIVRELPIHERSDGSLIPLSEMCYLESDFQPGPELQDQWNQLLLQATVIRRYNKYFFRQQELIPELDWNAVIGLALQAECPEHYAITIMIALSKVGTPHREILSLLKSKKWLPLETGVVTSPANIIGIDGADEDIRRVIGRGTEIIASVLELKPWIMEHSGYRALKSKIFPQLRDALNALGRYLGSLADMKLGLSDFHSSDDLSDFIEVFIGAPVGVMNIAAILDAIVRTGAEDAASACREFLIPNLIDGLTGARLRGIIGHLESAHYNAPVEKKNLFRKWFDRYLQEGFENGQLTSILSDIKLLNQMGEWKETTQLAWPMQGIDPSDQVNPKQADLIRRKDERGRRPQLDLQALTAEVERGIRDAAERIIKFFRTFEPLVPSEVIGAVGALLGDYPIIRDWAGRLLGGSSEVDIVREEMFLKMKISDVWTSDSIRKAISDIRYQCLVISTRTVKIPSIAGVEFEAVIATQPESLLVSDGADLAGQSFQGRRMLRLIEMRNIDDYSPTRIEELLQNTAELIAYHSFFCKEKPAFGDLFQKLGQTGQRDIHKAQVMLLNVGDFYVKQLGCDKFPILKNNIMKWDDARRCEADIELYPAQAQKLLSQSQALKIQAKRELKGILEENEDAHRILVEGVRKKLKTYQYSCTSIPFELFQNADDAYQEALSIHQTEDAVRHGESFVMEAEENALNFMHWGRPINYSGGSEVFDRGREIGFDRDLEKMVTLSFSDKDRSGSISVTGKFGLGFKSVFFATDAPEVVSVKIAFRVRSGFYPIALMPEEIVQIQQKLIMQDERREREGTIIRLPLHREGALQLNAILDRFESLIDFQLLFAKRIQCCIIKRGEANTQIFRSINEQIGDRAICSVSQLLSGPAHGKSLLRLIPSNGIVSGCSIVFGVGAVGFEKLSAEVPSIWITAPTRETTTCGFIVNAPFEPDVGRARLAIESEVNEALTKDLCLAARHAFEYLHDCVVVNYKELSNKLRLSPHFSEDLLWESFWNLLTDDSLINAAKEQKGSGARVMHDLIWGHQEGGYAGFIKGRGVIPSGLSGNYSVLLSIQQIMWYVEGLLDLDEMFSIVSSWSSFVNAYGIGEVVSNGRVYSKLRCLFPGFDGNARKVTLDDVIKSEVGSGFKADPEFAHRLGGLIDKETHRKLKEGQLGQHKDRQQFFELLESLSFKSEDGHYHLPKKLIVTRKIGETISGEEVLRSTIAPPSQRLSPDYSDRAIELFALCRERLDAPADTIARWVIEAIPEFLNNIFIYLLSGELRYEVSKKLGKQWAESAFQSEEYEALHFGEQSELRWLFKMDSPIIPSQIREPLPSLESIHEWWVKNQKNLLEIYETEIFPGGKALRLEHGDLDHIDKSSEVRKKWIKLFMMGSFFTMGRTIPGQHRKFLEMFERKGWLDSLSAPDADRSSLVGILDEYLQDSESRSEYYYWMRQFINFYQAARWLREYVFAIAQIEHIRERFALTNFFNLMDNPLMTGTGIEAPPFIRGMGGGACFIIRELIRSGFFTNPLAQEHAYVPTKGTRDLLGILGCSLPVAWSKMELSRTIYEFLEQRLGSDRATFCGSFDIPFALLARRRDLLIDVLGYDTAMDEEAGYFDDEENNKGGE